jgi:hypothetical protein
MVRKGRVLFGTAGVEDHIMYAQTTSEPGKSGRVLRLVAGGGSSRGRTAGAAFSTAGWRIEV